MSEEARQQTEDEPRAPLKLQCPKCRKTVEYDDALCECGWEIHLPDIRWKLSVPHAYVLHWMAQGYRRLHYPLDSSERSKWPAFDYAWRAFNHLYNELDPGQSNDMVRVKKALKETNTETLLIRLRRVADQFQGDLATKQENQDKNHPHLNQTSDELPRIRELEAICSNLGGVNDQLDPLSATDIIGEIYKARHQRFHGHPPGNSIRKSTREIVVLDWMAQSILDVDTFLLGHITSMHENDIEAYVLSRAFQLLSEIQESVRSLFLPEWVRRGLFKA